jgi:hypothetical protein
MINVKKQCTITWYCHQHLKTFTLMHYCHWCHRQNRERRKATPIGVVSFGEEPMSKSSKQLNYKDSTKAELVGASDYHLYPTWGKASEVGRVLHLKTNTFYQDKPEHQRFERNGRRSWTKTRHIDILVFLYQKIGTLLT